MYNAYTTNLFMASFFVKNFTFRQCAETLPKLWCFLGSVRINLNRKEKISGTVFLRLKLLPILCIADLDIGSVNLKHCYVHLFEFGSQQDSEFKGWSIIQFSAH